MCPTHLYANEEGEGRIFVWDTVVFGQMNSTIRSSFYLRVISVLGCVSVGLEAESTGFLCKLILCKAERNYKEKPPTEKFIQEWARRSLFDNCKVVRSAHQRVFDANCFCYVHLFCLSCVLRSLFLCFMMFVLFLL